MYTELHLKSISKPLKVETTDTSKWYHTFSIPKRSGGTRSICAPAEWLKEVQRIIYSEILLPNFAVSKYAYGGIKKKSIKDAADIHAENAVKLKIDISDFFTNVSTSLIRKELSKVLPEGDVEAIIYLCTKDGGLPQGGVTSMSLSAIAMSPMYNALGKISARMGLEFSAYVDDLVFSGHEPQKIIPLVEKVCKFYGHSVNKKKTTIMRGKQEVLGLCTTPDKPHARLKGRVRNKIRGMLHSLIKGAESGNKCSNRNLEYIQGMVAFARMAGDQKAPVFKEQLGRLKELNKNL